MEDANVEEFSRALIKNIIAKEKRIIELYNSSLPTFSKSDWYSSDSQLKQLDQESINIFNKAVDYVSFRKELIMELLKHSPSNTMLVEVVQKADNIIKVMHSNTGVFNGH